MQVGDSEAGRRKRSPLMKSCISPKVYDFNIKLSIKNFCFSATNMYLEGILQHIFNLNIKMIYHSIIKILKQFTITFICNKNM